MYMLLDAALGGEATYTLPLYTSESPLGMRLTDDLGLGVYFEMALILDAEDEMDISSGFHLKVEDGLAIQIPLFSQNVTNITLNGGQFEFLPVTINGAASSFSAILQVGIHAGFNIVDDSFDHFGVDISYAAGVDVGVFANVAEFSTNLTLQESSDDCQAHLAQDYTLALGAAAGLRLTLDTHRWGPTPATTVPVYFTSLPTACVSSGITPTTSTTTITSTAGAEKRQNLATTTITTAVTYTGVSCESRGLIDCPASLQSTSTSTSSTTFVTVLASGESLTLPIGVQTTVPSTVDFGDLAVTFGSTSGSPVSYNPSSTFNVPGAASSALHKIESGLNGNIHGVSKRLIFGLVFGFGMLLIILLGVGICLCCRKRKQKRNNPASVVILERDNGGNKPRFFNRRENKGGMSVVQN